MDEPLLWLGLVLCAAATVVGLLPLPRRLRLAGLSAGLIIAPVLLAADNWDAEQVVELRDRPLVAVAAIAVGAVVVLAVALLFRRRPVLLAPLLVAALPFRVPVELGGGGEPANLLLPLYVLIAAALVAAWLSELSGNDAEQAAEERGWLRWTGPALGLFVAVYALGAGYADDLSGAVENVAFFFAPFAALFALLAEVRWDRAAIRAVVMVLAIEGALFALVAAGQYATGELFWNDKVIDGNEAHTYFRVNSLFWDPNILGRYLAVTMVALAAVVAFGRERRELLAASALFVVLLAALVVTFSQSSTIALIGGVLVLIATRFGTVDRDRGRRRRPSLAVLASLTLIAGGGLTDQEEGRSGLIDGGIDIVVDAPFVGTGSGSFPEEFKERFGGGPGIALESHTEPITVLAEQGAVGFAAYAILLAVTIGGLLAATGLTMRGRARGAPLACALLAVYAVMVIHSLGYAAFLTDPITWAVLALAAGALAPAAIPRETRAPARQPA